MAFKYFCFDLSTTFLLKVYSKLVKSEKCYRNTAVLKILTVRMYIGFIVNVCITITINFVKPKDLNEEDDPINLLLWFILLIALFSSIFSRYIICKIISTTKEQQLRRSRFWMLLISFYRISEITIDSFIFVFGFISTDFYTTPLIRGGAAAAYSLEMLTCVFVLVKSKMDDYTFRRRNLKINPVTLYRT